MAAALTHSKPETCQNGMTGASQCRIMGYVLPKRRGGRGVDIYILWRYILRACTKKTKEYIEYWKHALNLKDWHINLERTSTKGHMASIDVFGYDQEDAGPIEARTATLKVNFKLIQNEKELSKTILHELIHVLLSKIVMCPKTVTDQIDIEQVVRTIEDTIWYFHYDKEE